MLTTELKLSALPTAKVFST